MAMANPRTSGHKMKGGIDVWLCKLLGHKPRMFEGTMTTHVGNKVIGPGDFTGLFCARCGKDLAPSMVQTHEDRLPEGSRIYSREETNRIFGLGNGMGYKHRVTYVIHDKTINPTIWVDGEEMAIVSCDYHYVTMSDEDNSGESILTATVVHHTTDPTQHVVSINQRTGQVFYQ